MTSTPRARRAAATLEAAADVPVDASADSKMAFMPTTEFVYEGELPALDGPAASWFFPAGQQPDLDRIARARCIAGCRGMSSSPVTDQGGGWAVGPEDYSAAVLSVGSDGMLTWYLSGAPSAIGLGCVSPPGVADVATSDSGSGKSGVAVDVAPITDPGPAPETTLVEGTVAPDVVPNDCTMPRPPVGVPTKDEALAKAKQLFAEWGYDVDSYQFDDAYADEWGASVNAYLLLDGMKAPVTLSAGFGENSC